MSDGIRGRFRATGATRRGGFTLVELLTVMALGALLMGITAGALARMGRTTALVDAERLIRGALVRARTAARTRGTPGSVVVLPSEQRKPPRLVLAMVRDVATWHFEGEGSRALGGRNHYALLEGVRRVEGGTLGRCLELTGGARLVCAPDARFDPVRGFSLAFDLRPDAEGGGGLLARFGETFSLSLEDDGSLKAVLVTAGSLEEITLKVAPGRLSRGRWSRLELAFDGLEALLSVNNVVEARRPVKEGRLVKPHGQARLILGGSGFSGLLDEAVYRSRQLEEEFELDAALLVPVEGPLEVRFDKDGRLDPRVHPEGPVKIPLELEDEKTAILVEPSGVMR